MFKRLFASSVAFLVLVSIGYAQVGQGSVKGKVIDTESGDPLPFVNVVVEQKGNIITGSTTDFDGKYVIKSISPGKYDIKVKFVGYKPTLIQGVLVTAGKIQFVDIKMGTTAVQMDAFEVIEYTVPLIDKDNTTSGGTMTSEEIDRMATRSASGVAQQIGGVYSDNSGNLNVRGARSDANYYYIDGIKVRGGANSLPQSAIEQVSVMLGGVPAQYGDVTGGIISITTKGAAREYAGSVEYVTSGYRFDQRKHFGLDPYAYNLVEFSAMGPIAWKKDSANKKTDPLLGFFIAGNYNFVADPRPNHLGYWRVKDDVQEELKKTPLRQRPTGTGTAKNAEFLRLKDLENSKYRQNAQVQSINVQGKLEVNTGKTTNLTFGGTFGYRDANNASFSNSLMNYQYGSKTKSNRYRGYGRFTQRFNNNDQKGSKSSIISNGYYSLQFDYVTNSTSTQDPVHENDIFDYGYVGKFRRYQTEDYIRGVDPNSGRIGYIQQTYVDTLIGFTPGDANPEAAKYTSNYYELFGWERYDKSGNPVFDPIKANRPEYFDPTQNAGVKQNEFLSEINTMRTNGALFNGDGQGSAYGLWNVPGVRTGGYSMGNFNQYRITAQGAVDIGDHELKVGFEWEQRIDRSYSVGQNGATNVWSLGRQYTNGHLSQLDFSNPTVEFLPNQPGDPTYTYTRFNSAPGEYTDEDPQSFFDYNLRKALLLNADGNDFVDFDNVDPSDLKLEYFSPDELLNNGSSIVNYYGYDAYGTRTNGSTLDNFFNKKDAFGNHTREIDAFRPIYIAGYIQDKFSINDLIFNIGLRIDRYDANQQVLKDPYVLFPTVKAGENLAEQGLREYVKPTNIGDDYIVYVDDVKNPTAVNGFRNGNTWYNAQGVEIDNPDLIATSAGIAPLLVDKNRTNSSQLNVDGFEDYKAQTNFMPRIAFSFPISDEANFFAHYDILTKRPTGGFERLNPTDYLYISSTLGSARRSNPNLKAEKTIDYEIGFQQKLSQSSAVKISGFYREMRDQVQVVRRKQAYPRSYTTFDNVDFGTVKGLTIAYDLRRTGNVSLKASYTLQFAEGTGSNQTTALSLINAGKDNLKVTSPYSFDQRHGITGVFDFRYGEGKDYNGPVLWDKQVLNRFGFNISANVGSGVPYSGQVNSTGTGFFTPTGSALINGSINGNRLPWSFRMDARFDKDFTLKVGKDKTKKLNCTVYLQVLNLLNTKNIAGVYRYTGDPEDDGYLNDPTWASDIQGQNDTQSFQELYGIKTARGTNYNIPRQTRLGLRVAF